MFLSNLSKREKNFLYLTAGIVSLSLIYNFLFKPLAKVWNELNRQIYDKEVELMKNIKLLKEKETVRKIYQAYAGYVKEKASDEQEMAALLNQVEKEARAVDVHIASIRPKPTKQMSFYKKYIVEMNCQASLEKYIEFMYNLHKSAQLIRVEDLKLISQGEDNPLLKAQMLVTKVSTTN